MELAKFEEPLREQLRAARDAPSGSANRPAEAASRRKSERQCHSRRALSIPSSGCRRAQGLRRQGRRDPCDQAGGDVRAGIGRARRACSQRRLFHRGDHAQPKQVVQPAPPLVAMPEDAPLSFAANDSSLPTTGRRLALARWLASSDNPLTARVLVNRVWMHHFGEGLVASKATSAWRGAAQPPCPARLLWPAGLWQRLAASRPAPATVTSTAAGRASNRSPRHRIPRTGCRPLAVRRLDAESMRDRCWPCVPPADSEARRQCRPDELGRIVLARTVRRQRRHRGTRRWAGPPPLYVQQRRSQPVGSCRPSMPRRWCPTAKPQRVGPWPHSRCSCSTGVHARGGRALAERAVDPPR